MKKTKIKFQFILLFLSIGLFSQNSNMVVSGMLIDSNTEKKIVNAQIDVRKPKNGVLKSYEGYSYTNFDGYFELPKLETGTTIYITFKAKNYTTHEITYNVTKGLNYLDRVKLTPETNSKTVSGTIKTNNEKPLNDIKIKYRINKGLWETTSSNQNGDYQIKELELGDNIELNLELTDEQEKTYQKHKTIDKFSISKNSSDNKEKDFILVPRSEILCKLNVKIVDYKDASINNASIIVFQDNGNGFKIIPDDNIVLKKNVFIIQNLQYESKIKIIVNAEKYEQGETDEFIIRDENYSKKIKLKPIQKTVMGVVQTNRKKPIANFRINYRFEGKTIQSTYTDENGNYSIPYLEPGKDITIHPVLKDDMIEIYQEPISLSFKISETDKENRKKDFILTPLSEKICTVHGKIFKKNSPFPIVKAQLSLFEEKEGKLKEKLIDYNPIYGNKFTITNIRYGTRLKIVTNAKGYEQMETAIFTVDQEKYPIKIELSPTLKTIRGTIETYQGKYLSNVKVNYKINGENLKKVFTDSNGDYKIDSLVIGQKVKIILNFNDSLLNKYQRVDPIYHIVKENDIENIEQNFILTDLSETFCTFIGTVVNKNDKPIKNANYIVHQINNNIKSKYPTENISTDNGNIKISNISYGTKIRLRINAPGYETNTKDYNIEKKLSSNNHIKDEIELIKLKTISGEIKTTNGKSINNSNLKYKKNKGKKQSLNIDSIGNYTIENLRPKDEIEISFATKNRYRKINHKSFNVSENDNINENQNIILTRTIPPEYWVAGGSIVCSAVFEYASQSKKNKFEAPSTPIEDLPKLKRQSDNFRTSAIISGGLGIAALGIGYYLFEKQPNKGLFQKKEADISFMLLPTYIPQQPQGMQFSFAINF